MSAYFGEPWPSGICDGGTRVPTPAGVFCALCDEAIGPNDRGSFIGSATGPQPLHAECGLKNAIGGIEHLEAGPHEAGECYAGSALTYRQSALAAWDWVAKHGMPHEGFAR